eukprot:scaffold42784_cov214-Amphora_coffeaeformis.AAC.1
MVPYHAWVGIGIKQQHTRAEQSNNPWNTLQFTVNIDFTSNGDSSLFALYGRRTNFVRYYRGKCRRCRGANSLRTPCGDIIVQSIFSGETDIEAHQLYATVLAPFALGVPAATVQMYCSRRFRPFSRETWQASEVFANEIGGQRAIVVPDYFHYFLEVMNRAKS